MKGMRPRLSSALASRWLGVALEGIDSQGAILLIPKPVVRRAVLAQPELVGQFTLPALAHRRGGHGPVLCRLLAPDLDSAGHCLGLFRNRYRQHAMIPRCIDLFAVHRIG
jgi:hypothetical protein